MTRAARVAVAAALIFCASVFAGAQQGTRRIATVAAIRNFSSFYHAQPVLVRGELRDPERAPVLAAGEDAIRLMSRQALPDAGTYDVRAEVIDVGRLSHDDPRVPMLDLNTLGIDAEHWPRQGELVVLRATGFEPARPLAAPSVRNLALDPERYLDQRVTVAGQFRGRNLFGDLPQAPAASKDSKGEFVLKSADAAIWARGKRPKGRGFDLDTDSRLDTNRWLEVSGVVHQDRGLVWVDVDDISLTEPQKEAAPEETAAAPPPAPIPPEVLFSAPTQDETDVPVTTHVRVQFSRDIKPESFKGSVHIGYSSQQSGERGEPQPPAVQPQMQYDPAGRILDIGFAAPLERFRLVVIELNGLTGTDGVPMAPWRLTFTTGG